MQQLQSRALKKGKIEEGRKEKVMLGFAKTNDPIWALSLEPVRDQECCKYASGSLLEVVGKLSLFFIFLWLYKLVND